MIGLGTFNKAMNYVFKQSPEEVQKDLPVTDIAWSEPSVIYATTDFEKYNPDDLIGVKGYAIYKKMMRDEQVKAVVKFKRDAVTSREYLFELDGEKYGLSGDEVTNRINLSYEIIEQLEGSWMDSLNNIMTAIYNGYSMNEKMFSQIEFNSLTFWGLQKIKLKPYDTFYFHTDEFGNIVRTVQKISGKEQNVDLDKFIKYVVNPDIDEHYGGSELREAHRAWFCKDIIIKFRNMWLEKHAGGFRYIQAKDGKTINVGTSEYTAMQNALNSVQTSTGMIIPNSVDIKGEYPNNNVAYKEAIDDYDVAIARALLVPNLLGVSPQGNVGSYSQSTNQLEAFLWTLEADAIRLEETLNEQLFRQLGKINFGDDAWPRFKFKPASGSKKLEIVSTWKDLVTSGAVKVEDADNEHIRSLLEMPKPVEKEKGSASVSQSQALNGIQVRSIVEIISKVATGELPKTSAIEIIIASFPMDREQVDAMVKDVEEGSIEPVISEEDEEGSDEEGSDEEGSDEEGSDEEGSDEEGSDEEGSDEEGSSDKGIDEIEEQDSTIIGKGMLISKAEFSKALRRVDFAVIGKTAESVVDEYVDKTADVMDILIGDLLRKTAMGGQLDSDIKKNLVLLKPDRQVVRKLERTMLAMLKEGISIGNKHAAFEIDKAKGSAFSRTVDKKQLKLIAEDYYKTTAFKITGNLTDEAVNTIEQEILNGAKYDKSWQDVEKSIYKTFATKGMISIDQAKDALGDALGVANPDARLRTIVRTSTFDAINNARHTYFTSPELKGFVIAYEYSAILDSRTTQICKHLDENSRGNHSMKWYNQNPQYKPPNHYNCRSLLIPVTEVDKDSFAEGDEPTQEPQDGFK